MYDRVLQENKGKWEKIAHKQCEVLFHPAEGALKEQAKRCVWGWVGRWGLVMAWL